LANKHSSFLPNLGQIRVGAPILAATPITATEKIRKEGQAVSTQAAAKREERGHKSNGSKDNWLGFVGDILKFSGEVSFKSMLRIDGHFDGHVTSPDGTLIVSNGAQITSAVINVAVAKINGVVEGDINASKELVLGRTASVTGNLTAPALIVEEGARFNGFCRRG
jgi:cytoskeletal protein CcmA (bactofilin family)